MPSAHIEEALVLLDSSLRIIAYDRGAVSILGCASESSRRVAISLPGDILNRIQNCKLRDLPSLKIHLTRDQHRFIGRAYLMEWAAWVLSPTIIAVHFVKALELNDTIQKCVVRYHLTTREQEVLSGLSLGLSTNKIANRMEISPNTVKVYLHNIMAKMGACSRTEIVTMMLQEERMFLADRAGVAQSWGSSRERQTDPASGCVRESLGGDRDAHFMPASPASIRPVRTERRQATPANAQACQAV